MVVVNATMDVAIAREVLMNLVAGNTEVGREDEAAHWAALLARLPAYQLDPDGALREWMWPGLEDQPNHRHLSHLYPLFPGYEIDPYDDSPLVAAARRAALTDSRATSRRRRAGRWHISRRSSLDSATVREPLIASRWLPGIA